MFAASLRVDCAIASLSKDIATYSDQDHAVKYRKQQGLSVMQLEDYLEFVSPDEIRIKGHRVGLEDVLKYYLAGYSPEQILGELPSLSLEKIHAAITYYLHDRVGVDAYLLRVSEWREHRYQEWIDSEFSPVVQRLRALKAERRENSLELT